MLNAETMPSFKKPAEMDVLPCFCRWDVMILAMCTPLFSSQGHSNAKDRNREHLQNIVVQTDQIRLAKNKVEVLERLGQPEALHTVRLGWYGLGHIVNCRIGEVGLGGILYALKHFPSDIVIFLVSCDAVEDENGFNGFWSAMVF